MSQTFGGGADFTQQRAARTGCYNVLSIIPVKENVGHLGMVLDHGHREGVHTVIAPGQRNLLIICGKRTF